jgi:hypothetical protein
MSAIIKKVPVKVLGGWCFIYLSEAPDIPPPLTHCMNTKGAGRVGELMRKFEAVEGRYSSQEGSKITDCISSL